MDVKRKVIELRKWMIEAGVRQIDVARKAGVSGAAVANVINHRTVSRNIKSVFLELGCPPELLERDVA